MASFLPGSERSDYRCQLQRRNKVVDAEGELNNFVKNELHDAAVLGLSNTLTPSTSTRSGQKLFDVRMNEDLWWECADGAGGDSAVTEGKVQARASGAGLGQADMRRDNGCGKERWPVAVASRRRRNDVSAGRNAGSLQRRSGVALPCASAIRSRLLAEVFDDYSQDDRKLSHRERTISREVNETVFALNFWRRAVLVLL